MYPKLNYLYFLLIPAICMVASCASDAPDSKQEEEKIEKGAELSFTTSDLTRAVTTSFGEFTVYGDMKIKGANDSAPLVIFNKTGVKYLNNSWSYDVTQYWYHNHEHSFVAVTPSSVLADAGSPQYSNSGLTFTYTIPTAGGLIADRNDVADILAASHRRLYTEKKDPSTQKILPEPGVKLKFSHLLSMVNVALALNDDIMKGSEFVLVHKLEMSGIRNKASFNILPEAIETDNQTDKNAVKVTGQDGDAKLTIEYAEPKKLTNKGGAVSFFAAGDALIMLPQVFAADSKAKIVFTYTVNGDTEAPKTVSLLLKDMKWESGKSYNLQGVFEIDKAEVKLKPMSIAEWTETELKGEVVSSD